MLKNLRFRQKKVKFWQKVLLICNLIFKTEGDPNTHDNAYYQLKSWKFLTKIDENQRKMTKNDEKREKMTFFQVFSWFERKNSKKYEIEGAPAPEIAYFYTTVIGILKNQIYQSQMTFLYLVHLPIVINWLMESVGAWLKVIPLSGVYCI